MYKYLKGGCKEDAVRLFSVVCSDGRRDNGLKLKIRKFCLNMKGRGGSFYCEDAKTLTKVAQRGCGVSIPVNVKDPTKALRNLFQVTLQDGCIRFSPRCLKTSNVVWLYEIMNTIWSFVFKIAVLFLIRSGPRVYRLADLLADLKTL